MRRVSTAACAFVCAAVVFAQLPARADVAQAGALSAGLAEPSNASLKRVLEEMKNPAGDPKTVAQANPVGTPMKPLTRPGLPQGFTYNVDLSFAYPINNVGFSAKDPGGFDAGFGYAFSRTNRLTVGY